MKGKPEFLHNTENGGVFKVPNDYVFTTNDYMNNKIKVMAKKKITNYDNDESSFKNKNENISYKKCVKTNEQINAIADYTSDTGYGGSEMVNRFLNGEKEVSKEVAEIIRKKADIIESCISQPLKEDIYFYRGMDIKVEDLKVGQSLDNKGFTSGSIYETDAKKHGQVIKTKAFSGQKALYIGDDTSHEESEHEILFGKNHSTVITKIKKNNGKYEIEAELRKRS